MEKSIKVSVILPSLNVAKYIRQCVESVISQTLKEIEIICVDAGSTDGTLEILREYESTDKRIHIIISEIKSYGYQMNIGIKAARGKYIGIVETDDFVAPEMFEELYGIAYKNDLDLIKSDFYRFTGEGDIFSKAYQSLGGHDGHYNQVLDTSEDLNVFKYQMNTWCGIYKRSWLQENDIRHNESPGASYQDNGFWFLTFIHAKKAYFLNKAYYYNRRDNEDSSVHSKEKVYCICDEYRRLSDILTVDTSLRDRFKAAFTYAGYRAYNGNLNRIGKGYRQDFIKVWAEDFREYESEGLIDTGLMDELDKQMLYRIMDDHDKFYRKETAKEEAFLGEIRKHKNIILYGAGMIGKRICDGLLDGEDPADVISFAVSDKTDNYESYRGVPIRIIDELSKYKETGSIVIATSHLYSDGIRERLEKEGYKNIIIW